MSLPPPENPAPPITPAIRFSSVDPVAEGGEQPKRIRFGIYAIALILVFAVASRMQTSAGIALLATLAAAVLFALVQWVYFRPPDAALDRTDRLMRSAPSHSRVCCHGRSRLIARVLSRGDPVDSFFEPQVFRVFGAHKPDERQQLAQWLCGFVVFAALMWGQYRFSRAADLYVAVIGSIAGGSLIGGFLFPTYLRLVPGRMDILQCGFLGRTILSSRSIDLRIPKVVVDLTAEVLILDDGKAIEPIGFAATWDRPAFARAVLQAAMSTHTPPPLPSDALVG
jgi:hypothetical protein